MSTSYYAGSSSTSGTVRLGSNSTASTVRIPVDKRSFRTSKQSLRKKRHEEKKIDAAVYGYMQAIRALNRTKINSYQISKALDLPVWKITDSIERLQNQGIKINRIC